MDDQGAKSPALLRAGSVQTVPTVSAARQRYTQLCAAIPQRKKLIAQWKDFVPQFELKRAQQLMPLQRRLRKVRVGMAQTLDRGLRNGTLKRSQQRRAQQLLLDMLAQLLREAPDDALEQLFYQHQPSDDPFFSLNEIKDSRRLASHLADASPDAATASEDARQERQRRAASREAQFKREAAAPAEADAVRDLYRRLARQLHPDREPDPQEQLRKTALMQQINAAYGARDLITLLELGGEHALLNDGAQGAEDAIRQYNRVLEEQLFCLDMDLMDLTEPFREWLEQAALQDLSPQLLDQRLNRELRQLKAQVQSAEDELKFLREPGALALWLESVRGS